MEQVIPKSFLKHCSGRYQVELVLQECDHPLTTWDVFQQVTIDYDETAEILKQLEVMGRIMCDKGGSTDYWAGHEDPRLCIVVNRNQEPEWHTKNATSV